MGVIKVSDSLEMFGHMIMKMYRHGGGGVQKTGILQEIVGKIGILFPIYQNEY